MPQRRKQTRKRRSGAASAALLLGLSALCLSELGCRKPEAPQQVPSVPSLRLYLLSNVAGALEPCGCRKDMLGGIDHAAALLGAGRAEAPERLLLGAGPFLFQDPQLDPARGDQDQWKAESLADSLASLPLAAWAPGANDFAAGRPALGQLAARSRARLLGANLAPGELPWSSTASFTVGGYRVGVAGIAAGPEPAEPGTSTATALADAARALDAAGAQIKVALITAARGEALRLAEQVPGFSVVLLGKPTESGDGNDAPAPPTLLGDTLVVQTSNHLQTIAVVDLFVKGDDFHFQDGMGLAQQERRESLERKARDLEARLQRWRSEQPPVVDRIQVGERDLEQTRQELKKVERSAGAMPQNGSSFRYHLLEVREAAGAEPSVTARMGEYYRRVNTHNREAFADRVPAPAAPGTAHYVGAEACSHCHDSADRFWRTTGHAGAYQTLATEFKEFNLDCVGCHVTGYNRPGGSTVTHVEKLQNVQCEACHGPGSLHAASAGSSELITLTPQPTVCKGCHHAPHVADDWSFERAWPHIVGPGHGAKAKPPAK